MRILITLGGPLNIDCTPSDHLLSRINETIRQYKDGDIVFVTGSRPKGMPQSEAFVMSEYLKKSGVTNVVLEERATSTVENAYFTHKLIEKMNIKSDTQIVVITSDFHIPRTSLIFLHFFKLYKMSFCASKTITNDNFSLSELYKLSNLLSNFPPNYTDRISLLSEVIRGNMCGVKDNIDKILEVDTNTGSTALHYSASYGFLDITTFLLDSGINVDIQNNKCMTPLHYAIINGHVDIIWELLKRGANIDIYAENHRWNMTPQNVYGALYNIRSKLNAGTYTVILLLLAKYSKKQNSIIWIRHAESQMNRALSLKESTNCIFDAKLTQDGKKMVNYINSWIFKADLLADYKVFVSPLFRTLETAKHLLNGVDNIVPIVDHRICERLNHTSCIGTPKSELANLFSCDFSKVPEEWWYKPEENNLNTIKVSEESWDNLSERISSFYKDVIMGMSTKCKILVVTHGGVIWSIFEKKLQARNCDAFESSY